MKKKIISIIALCLLSAMLAGCASVTERRKNKVQKLLEEDLIEVDYITLNSQTMEYTSNVKEDGSFSGGSYLFSTGTHYYVSTFKGELDAFYEINNISIADGTSEFVANIPQAEGFNDIVMIDTDCYYRYKVEEIYDDPGHVLLGFPNSYEYRWYKFTMDGQSSPTGYVYPSDDLMYGNQCKEMVKEVRDKLILSAMSLASPNAVEHLYTKQGIMSELSALASENEHDKLEFIGICGFDPESRSAVLQISYRASNGYHLVGNEHYGFNGCYLLDSQGEVRYIGKYNDLIKNERDVLIVLK